MEDSGYETFGTDTRLEARATRGQRFKSAAKRVGRLLFGDEEAGNKRYERERQQPRGWDVIREDAWTAVKNTRLLRRQAKDPEWKTDATSAFELESFRRDVFSLEDRIELPDTTNRENAPNKIRLVVDDYATVAPARTIDKIEVQLLADDEVVGFALFDEGVMQTLSAEEEGALESLTAAMWNQTETDLRN